jgi:uncharacterized protein YhbP (UPF0306 family)
MDKLSTKSAWSQSQVDDFLLKQTIPVRLAALDKGFPFICSLWYVYRSENRHLYCVSHKGSKIVELLEKEDRCAFEISPNEPPYLGVRGKAIATLSEHGAEPVLNEAIDRYLKASNSSLATWLLSRVNEEYLIDLSPVWWTAWDYSNRMEKTGA